MILQRAVLRRTSSPMLAAIRVADAVMTSRLRTGCMPPRAPLLYMVAGIGKLSLDKYVFPTMKLLCLGHLPMAPIVTFILDYSLALPRLAMGIE